MSFRVTVHRKFTVSSNVTGVVGATQRDGVLVSCVFAAVVLLSCRVMSNVARHDTIFSVLCLSKLLVSVVFAERLVALSSRQRHDCVVMTNK